MSKFFLKSDFEAFHEDFAISDDSAVIAKRKFVVDNRFKELHFNNGNIKSLKRFFEKYMLYPHWMEQHLTNVYWPLNIANNSYVNYLRMGYGKEEALIKLLADKLGLPTITNNGFTKKDMAFYSTTQLQVGIDYNGWWTNLYIDKSGWVEIKNLYSKITTSKQNEQHFIELLDDISEEYYYLYLISVEKGEYEATSSEDFINTFKEWNDKKYNFGISIMNYVSEEDEENNKDTILTYLISEFEKLMPLYEFISWHPKTNNFIR